MTWQLPFPVVFDEFGSLSPERKKLTGKPHRGCDYNGLDPKTKKKIYKFGKGTPLPAINDGVISQNYWSDILGWVVELKVAAPWGKERKTKPLYFMYCHLDKQSPLKVGTKVASGDSVGGAGTTGSASSGVHLHFALSDTTKGGAIGKVFDAHAYLSRRIAEQEKE
jgi:murein DD-endopeptidase MepM/ murein hydrolase activator NlpD